MDAVKTKKTASNYMARMAEIRKGARNATGFDFLLKCPEPECGDFMEFKGGIWQCLTRKCRAVLPEEFAPPGPEQIKQLIAHRKEHEAIEKWSSFLK